LGDPKAAVHQVFHGWDHVVAEAHVEGRLEAMDLLRQPRESAPVQPRDDEDLREDTVIMRGLEDAHLGIEVIELHRATPPP
jgi:hypothetical protein